VFENKKAETITIPIPKRIAKALKVNNFFNITFDL